MEIGWNFFSSNKWSMFLRSEHGNKFHSCFKNTAAK